MAARVIDGKGLFWGVGRGRRRAAESVRSRSRGLSVILLSMLVIAVWGTGALAAGGGELKIALGVGIDNLNPPLINTQIGAGAARHVLEGLLRLGPEGKPEPELASSWDVSADGLTWVFHLREGVTFHDGTAFDASAVAANLNHVADKANAYARASTLMDVVASWEVVGPYAIALHLKRQTGDLLGRLCYHAYIMVSPKALAEYGPKQIGLHPVGTGPFKVDQFVPLQTLTVVRNEAYWRQAPKLDRITWVTITEEGSRAAAVEAGDVDVAIPLSAISRGPITAKQGLDFVVEKGARIAFISINTHVPALSDVRVREAMNLGIDRQLLIDTFLSGIATAPISIIAASLVGATKVYDYTYNPARAKELLAAAGWTKGADGRLRNAAGELFPTLNLVTYRGRYPGDFETAQAVAAQLGEIGFDVKLQELEFSSETAELRKDINRTPDATTQLGVVGLGSGYLDGAFSLDYFDARKKSVNWYYLFGYTGEAFWPDLDLANSTSDEAVRLAALERAQRIIAQDHPIMPLYDVLQPAAIWKYVKGWWSVGIDGWWFGDAWLEK